ncbi:helix-turn-helix domain-containing protein [Lentzea sp. HUAS TT2]|uniref:helix-turn-helix domain-containing protein n=1 Tax=Lentzea sp. HUAS TT2 TaxID=3447454 RepID=UPI003F71E6F2
MSAHVRVRPDALERIGIAQGLTSRYKLAKRLGVSPSTISRVLDGEQLPGNAMIALTLEKLEVSFYDVFEIARTNNGAAA